MISPCIHCQENTSFVTPGGLWRARWGVGALHKGRKEDTRRL